jgi:hypothetical protein
MAKAERIIARLCSRLSWLITTPRGAWVDTLVSYGVPRVFATSFLETVEQGDNSRQQTALMAVDAIGKMTQITVE